MSPGNAAADRLRGRHGRPPSNAAPANVGAGDPNRCDRCAAANNLPGGRVEFRKPSQPTEWDPSYRMCRACRLAVAHLLDATATRPVRECDGWTFAAHPAHTGHPHFLWRPAKDGLVGQIAAADGASSTPPVSGAPGAKEAPLAGDHGRTTTGGAR